PRRWINVLGFGRREGPVLVVASSPAGLRCTALYAMCATMPRPRRSAACPLLTVAPRLARAACLPSTAATASRSAFPLTPSSVISSFPRTGLLEMRPGNALSIRLESRESATPSPIHLAVTAHGESGCGFDSGTLLLWEAIRPSRPGKTGTSLSASQEECRA